MTNTKLTVSQQLSNEPRRLIKILIGIVVAVVILVPSITTIEFRGMPENGLIIAGNIIKGILNPSMKLALNFTEYGLAYLLLETVAMAFLGTLIGTVVAVPLAFISARNITPRFISTTGVLLITIIRTFPTFVYGLMFIRVTGPGAFAGVLTLALTSVGMLAKLFIEAIEDLDISILEALDATGCSTFQKIRYGIIPQLMSNLVSIVIYRFDINVKNASVLGLVGAGGIGAPLLFAMAAYRWSEVGALLLGLILLVLVIEFCSTKIRTKLASGE